MAAAGSLIAARPSTSFLLAAAALGLVLRLAFGFGYWVDEDLTRDEREYLSLARSLAAGHGFEYDEAVRQGTQDPFGRAPGYPAFLAVAGGGRGVVEHVPGLVKISQALVGSLGVVMAGVLAWTLAGPGAARWAAIGAACYPPLVWVSSYAFSEALFWPLGLAVAWLFDRATRAVPRRVVQLALVTGALAGACVLIRPAMIFFLLLAGPYLLWTRRWTMLAGLTVGALLIVGPWTARNYQVHGRFVLVATEGGVTFWTGNHPRARGEGDMAANPELKKASLALRAAYPQLTEEAMEPVYYREALGWIRAHPGDWLVLEAKKLFYLIVPIGPSYTLHSRRYVVASVASYALVLPLALVGLWRLGHRVRVAPGLWLLTGSAVAVCLTFFPQERFRTPVIDPALLILAGAAIGRRTAEARAA